MDIQIIPAYDRQQELSVLFSEYTDMLIAGDSSFQAHLDIQHYEEEIRRLDTKYGLLDFYEIGSITIHNPKEPLPRQMSA